MKICIAGWYHIPEFLDAVKRSGYSAFIVQHREGDARGIPSTLVPNVGLEFGCYDHYLKQEWDGTSDVLFMHDDTIIHGTKVFDQIARIMEANVEFAFIFHDEWEYSGNAGHHGRAMWASGAFLKKLLDRGGFPYDAENNGFNDSIGAENKGIKNFVALLKTMGDADGVVAFIPDLQNGRRGALSTVPYLYRTQAVMIAGGTIEVL